MSDSLKHKASNALFWNFIDKGGQQIIQMIIVCILARILNPEEFGLMAILMTFWVIAILLQESGFGSALIRKKEVDEIDFSSVFYFNIFVSIILYIILFFAAPYIAAYFEQPILVNLSRFVFLVFLFSSAGFIQNVQVYRNLDFKTNTKITFISGIIGGAVGIGMALKGYGVWSLAVQLVLQSGLRAVLLCIIIRWKPKTGFSFQRIKSMFKYSVHLLINSIINQLSTRIYSIIIGKHFSISDAGYYDQAYKFNSIPQSIIGGSIQSVALPVLSKLDSNDRIKRLYRKFIRISAFISFPIAMFTIVAANPIISLLLSDKWILIVPYLQILAIGWAFYPQLTLANSFLQAMGKSSLILKLETTRSLLYIAVAIISILLEKGVLGLVWGFSMVNVVSFFITYAIAGQCVHYNLKEAIKDIFPYVFLAAIVFAPFYLIELLNINNILQLIIQACLGGTIYLVIIKLLGSQVFNDCIEFLKQKKQ